MKEILWIILGVCAIILASRLSFDIPYTQVNITGQTLVVLSLPFLLKPKSSILVISIYLILGIFGLKVFSDGNAGLSYFLDSSLGYFVGFVLATLFMIYNFWKKDLRQNRDYLYLLILHIFGTLIILVCGTTRLCFMMDLPSAFLAGFSPFILSGFIKSVLGALIVFLVYKKQT